MARPGGKGSGRRRRERAVRPADGLGAVRSCHIGASWRKRHLAQILLVRAAPLGRLAAAVFLVDLGCLGVKDCFVRPRLSPHRIRELRAAMNETDEMVACEPELAAAIVLGAVAYASDLGFDPCPDFASARPFLDGLDPAASPEEPEFGLKGKPLYVSGPDDDVAAILAQLRTRCGRDGFDYVVGDPDPQVERELLGEDGHGGLGGRIVP